MLLYLAQPIDLAQPEQAEQQLVWGEVAGRSFVLSRPGGAEAATGEGADVDRSGFAGLLDQVAGYLVHDRGVALYDPRGAFQVAFPLVTESAAQIEQFNSSALRQADGLLAILPRQTQTLGTVSEIESALRWNKPTLILTDIRSGMSVILESWKTRGAQVECNIFELDDLTHWLKMWVLQVQGRIDEWNEKRKILNGETVSVEDR